MDEVAELFSHNTFINNQTANVRPLTAAVDGPNNRLALQQMAGQRGLNPNSVPFYPSQEMQPHSASDAQLHVYQQMQMMQMEIVRLQVCCINLIFSHGC